MDGRFIEFIMSFCIQLTQESTVNAISDWFHATFRAFSFVNVKTVGSVSGLCVLV